jgi:hypothetical protein
LPIVKTVRTTTQGNRRLVIESVAFGLGYTAVLIWFGSAMVAAFTADEAEPYWSVIPHLRTDTSGVIAFAIAVVTLAVSRYLQLGRRNGAPVQPAARTVVRPGGVLAVQAMAETAAFLATGMVIYLSFNSWTHPATLYLQLTHLWPWPSEGTVRVIGLAVCLVCVPASRYLRATARRPAEPAAVPGNASAWDDTSVYDR